MSATDPLRVVAYVARSHGLAGLRALIASDRYEVEAVVTHRYEPGSNRSVWREDYSDFRALADQAGASFHHVDSGSENAAMVGHIDSEAFDLIVSIDWRRRLTPRQLAQPRIGGVNVHRGAPPECSGAKPLVRALANGARWMEMVAHELTDDIDGGPVIVSSHHLIPEGGAEDELFHQMIAKMEVAPVLLEALDELVRRKAVVS